MKIDESLLSFIRQQILNTLDQFPDGVSEHDLLKALQNQCPEAFEENLFKDTQLLFNAHFLVFHLLYKIQAEGSQNKKFFLFISPMKIIKTFNSADINSSSLSNPDPLKLFYSDLNNLSSTSISTINTWLNNFWQHSKHNKERSMALKILGLPTDASEKEVRQRYKQLAQTAHPDKGGNEEEFKKINKAMTTLKFKL